MSTEIRLPRRFWDDHALRSDAEPIEPQRVTAREVVVTLTDEALADLLSDARYYADMGALGAFGPETSGIVASARATVRRIETATREAARA